MKLHKEKHVLDVSVGVIAGSTFEDVDMSGCRFHDVNFSGATIDDANCAGWRIEKANLAGWRVTNATLAGAAFTNCRYDGMTIDGIAVTDLIALWRAHQPAEPADPAAGPLPE